MGYQGEGMKCSNRIKPQTWEVERRRRNSPTQREQISPRQETYSLVLEELTYSLSFAPRLSWGLEHPGAYFPKEGAVSSFVSQGALSLGTANPRHNFKASEAWLSIFLPPCLHFLSHFLPSLISRCPSLPTPTPLCIFFLLPHSFIHQNSHSFAVMDFSLTRAI